MKEIFLAVFTNATVLFILCAFIVALYAVRLHHRRALHAIERSRMTAIDLGATPVLDVDRHIEADAIHRRR